MSDSTAPSVHPLLQPLAWIGGLFVRGRLIRPEYSLPVKTALYVYEFFASLGLAVLLLSWLAFTLGWATFLEAAYGTPASQYGAYQTWWFNLLMVLLGINIFCAASIRYPWKRHQTGFVVTHIGLLVLLGGTAVSRWQGIDAQMAIFETQSAGTAFQEDLQVRMWIVDEEEVADSVRAASNADQAAERMPKQVRDSWRQIGPLGFAPGPFNWNDTEDLFSLFRREETLGQTPAELLDQLPRNAARYVAGNIFQLARPAQTLYSDSSMQLEVIDYYSDAELIPAPSIQVVLSKLPRGNRVGGKQSQTFGGWNKPMRMSVRKAEDFFRGVDSEQVRSRFPAGIGESKPPAMGAPGTLTFGKVNSEAETALFVQGVPEGDLGPKGQLVLYADGQIFRIDPAEHDLFEDIPLGDTGVTVSMMNLDLHSRGRSPTSRPDQAVIELATRRGQDKGVLRLSAGEPHFNIHDRENRVYGMYWFDFEAEPYGELSAQEKLQGWRGTRFDIIQDHRLTLRYRRWDGSAVVASGKLESNGGPADSVVAFQIPLGDIRLYVQHHFKSQELTQGPAPKPFDREPFFLKNQLVKLRLTCYAPGAGSILPGFESESEPAVYEFFLSSNKNIDIKDIDERGGLYRWVHDKLNDRWILITMPLLREEVGFRVHVDEFERRLDPGTNQAAHYSSTVDFVDRDSERWLNILDADDGVRQRPESKRRFFDLGEPGVVESVVLDFPNGRSPDSLKGYYQGLMERLASLGGDDVGPEEKRAFAEDWSRTSLIEPGQAALDPDGRWLYWIEDRAIFRVDWTAVKKGRDAMIQPLRDLRSAEAFAAGAGRLFHYDVARNAIFVSALDPQDDFPRLRPSRLVPEAAAVQLAVDTLKGRLYWIDRRHRRIGRASLDGAEIERDWLTDVSATALAIAPGEAVYFADRRGIHRRGLDAAKAEQIIKLTETAGPTEADSRPTIAELAVDPLKNRLMWISSGKIWRMPSDGGTPEALADSGAEPAGLVVDPVGGRILWSERAVLRENVLITMNEPVEYTNPVNGRSYRLFQESFSGPEKPGSPTFESIVPQDDDRTELYRTVLTVNHDPGRWIWQIGCGLVVVGICIMFYMRAYFFVPGHTAADQR